jgi:hypothetical protein
MALLLSGCAADEGAAPTMTTQPPTTGLPSTPSDPRPPKDVLVGQVTRGGSGPCYGMVTDDGKEYAFYSTEGVTLDKGDTVKIQYEPLRLKIYCGAGEHVSAVKITKVK